MTREEFTFSVGFMGEVAIVDKEMVKKYGKCSTEELLDKGLYRAAFCSALYAQEKEDNEAEMEMLIKRIEKDCELNVLSVQQLMRLYGVFSIPSENVKVKAL